MRLKLQITGTVDTQIVFVAQPTWTVAEFKDAVAEMLDLKQISMRCHLDGFDLLDPFTLQSTLKSDEVVG